MPDKTLREVLPSEYHQFIPDETPDDLQGEKADAYRAGFALVQGLIEVEGVRPKKARHIAATAISDAKQMNKLKKSGIDGLFTTQN